MIVWCFVYSLSLYYVLRLLCVSMIGFCVLFFFSSRRRHTRCALVTGVQTCALPICELVGGHSVVRFPGFRRSRICSDGGSLQRRRLVHPDNRRTMPNRCGHRSEEHTSELQSLMRISYAVFCLKKKKKYTYTENYITMKLTKSQ